VFLDRVRAGLVSYLSKPVDHSVDVGCRAVLAELELGLKALDGHLDAHGGPELAVEELLRRVVDRPGCGEIGFVMVGEAADDVGDPVGIVAYR
jgi:hypothetical protein